MLRTLIVLRARRIRGVWPRALPVFEPMQPELLGAGSTFTNAFADYDNDGDPDLFVGFDGKPNRLYRNDKGTFVDVAARGRRRGLAADARGGVGRFRQRRRSRSAAWFHAVEGRLGAQAVSQHRGQVHRHDRRRRPRRAHRRGAAAGVDRLRRRRRSRSLRRLSRSRRTRCIATTPASSRDVAPTLGMADARRTVGAVWFDFDEDGDLDVAVANMDGDANGLFRNDGAKFTDVGRHRGRGVGRPRAESRRPTAPCASAPPTSTTTAASICSPPTTARSASSAIAARARSRIDRRRGASRSTHATTPARSRTSITMAVSISTSTAP